MRGKSLFAPVAVLLLLVSVVACSGGSAEDPQAAQNAELWNKVVEGKAAFDAKRAEIGTLEGQISELKASDGDGDGEAAADEAAGPSLEDLEKRLEDARTELSETSEELYGMTVEYINTSGIVEGEPLTQEQRAAFDTKAEIDISIAQEYIDRGGDYQRAINIYDQALSADPDSELLVAAKAEAERLRYMDEERFGMVKKGMSEGEVRDLLGTVMHTNVREFSENSRLGWFYRKEDGGASGVYFKPKKGTEDVWVVETLDFNAVKPPAQREEDPAG